MDGRFDSLGADGPGPDGYGEAFADVYDDWYGSISDVEATVAAVAALADGGRVLELGVGTGRIALPLAAAGVVVDGLDASPSMLARLAAKDPDGHVAVVLADMADPQLTRTYGLAFAAFNTFFNLWRAVDQQRCVAAVARHLVAPARFAVECFVPGTEPDDIQEHEDRRSDGAGGEVVRRSVRDPADQTVHGVLEHHAADGQVTARSWAIRYLHPDQLDALLAAEGFVLEHRWADWRGTAFDPDECTHHVSVYRRDGAPHG